MNRNEKIARATERHQHIVPREEGWALKKGRSNRVSFTFDTKRDALQKGKDLAKKQETVLVVHGKDGRVQQHLNYSNGTNGRS